ncbi:MAG: VTT domain-containing protein [Chloroflexota bacterium]
METLKHLLDPMYLLETFSYVGLFIIIFAESGLLIGFFLPGDSLLFTAGLLAATTLPGQTAPLFSLPVLCIGCFLAAVLGDSVGYMFGRRVGRRLFQRENSFLFSKKNLQRAQDFYDKNGSKTIVLARFIPVVRTFAPIVAGIGDMRYAVFVSYNLIGGFLWACGVTLAGYFLGQAFPDIDKYLLPIIVIIILVSVAPAAYHILKDPETRQGLRDTAMRAIGRKSATQPEPIEE